jgi:hypothetical protein
VQEIHPRFHEQSQKAISARLTALHGIGRFDTKAILQIKVRQVVEELLRRISELKQDRHRLRMRSRRLMRRLGGTICAYRWWQSSCSQKAECVGLTVLVYIAFEMERVVQDGAGDRSVIGSVT